MTVIQELDSSIPKHLTDWWTQDLWCLHSAGWWRRHWARTGILDIEIADTLSDAPRSELLEIATALGRVLPNTSNAEAITFLTNMRKTDPEVEVALAKIGPSQYVSGVAVALESGNGQMVSAVAQALGETCAIQTSPASDSGQPMRNARVSLAPRW